MNEILEILKNKNINGFEHPGGTDKATDHSYDEFYYNEFLKYKNKNILLLEIGVQYGGSALLWHDFLPRSNLVLLDQINQIDQNVLNNLKDIRYEFYSMDAFCEDSVGKLKNLYKGFDIIIDDGPHSLDSQIFTIKNYLPLLKQGGTLVIEDIQNYDYVEKIMKSVGDLPHKSCELVDLRHVKNRYDDLLIVVKK